MKLDESLFEDISSKYQVYLFTDKHKPVNEFENEEEAYKFCKDNGWKYCDKDGFCWFMDYKEQPISEDLDSQESRYFARELGNAISDVVYDYKDKGLSETELKKVIDDKVSSIVKRFKLSECISKESKNLGESYSDYLDPQSEVGMFIREFAKSIINGKALTDKQQKVYDLISELVIDNIDESLEESNLREAWSGVYSVNFLLNNLDRDIDKEEAKKFSDYLYYHHADEGYKHMYDILDDFNSLERWYDQFKKSISESLTEGKLDNSYKIVEKIKSYVDEGHIDKDELIYKLLQWFYSSPTFLSFIINNNILSEDEVDEIMLSESLTEDVVDDVVMIEVPDVIADIKETDITPKGPEVGVDTGIADMLLDLINGENDTIRDYNIFKANLESHPEFISAIEDITNEENNHVGMLQTLLKQISPNVETIKQGEAEAEKDLIDDSQSFEVSDFEVDDSFDNGFGGIYV